MSSLDVPDCLHGIKRSPQLSSLREVVRVELHSMLLIIILTNADLVFLRPACGVMHQNCAANPGNGEDRWLEIDNS